MFQTFSAPSPDEDECRPAMLTPTSESQKGTQISLGIRAVIGLLSKLLHVGQEVASCGAQNKGYI